MEKTSKDSAEQEKIFCVCLSADEQNQWIESCKERHLKDWANELIQKEIRQLAIETWFRLVVAE